MHVLGKVFLALTIVFALVNVYLSSVLLKHRTHWEKQIKDRRESYEKAHDTRISTQAQFSRVTHELNRIKTTWGDSVTTGADGGQLLNAANGTIGVAAGTALGLPEVVSGAPLKEMFVFIEDDAGKSRYLGAFRLQQCQADQSGYSLARAYMYPDEGANWAQVIPAGAKWRVRESVPSSWRKGFGDHDATYARVMKSLDNQRDLLRIETEQLAASQGILDQRYSELNGDPEPPEGASQDVIDGLVLTLRKEETERNAGLQLIDQLRHDYKRKIDRLNGLLLQNQTSVNKLPGASEAAARPPATAPVATTASGAAR
jgi:hypothetical protein